MSKPAAYLEPNPTRRTLLGILGAGCVAGGGRLMAGAGMTGTAWAGETRHPESTFNLPGFRGQAVAVSPDGRRVAVLGAFGGDVLILDAKGTVLRRFPRVGTTANLALDFMGNDAVVIPASSDSPNAMLQIVPATGSGAARDIPGPQAGDGSTSGNVAQYYAVSVNGGLAACMVDGGDSDHLTLANLRSGRTWNLDLRPALGKLDLVRAVAVSSDARQLAVGTSGNRILFLDPASGRLNSEIVVYPARTDAGLTALAFSPDGKRMAAGIPLSPDGMTQANRFPGLTLWSIADRRLIRAVETNAQPVPQTTWSPDGRYVAALVDRNEGGTQLLLLDTSGAEPDRWHAIADLQSIRFAADAPVLASLTPNRIKLMSF